ncbi:MAG TPA: hypothetical protein VF059_00990, partial [Casimicrobiaceae bacterium]
MEVDTTSVAGRPKDAVSAGGGAAATAAGAGAARPDAARSAALAAQEPRVRAFAAGDEAIWDRFVDAMPDATFFHRAAWRDLLETVFHHRAHYLIAERSGAVCGVLPLAEIRSRLFGHSLVSLPFCVYGGPVAADAAAERALVDAGAALGESLGVAHLELRNRSRRRADWPCQDLYVTFRKALAADVDANMKAIPRKQRAMVRKGIGHGLRSEVDGSTERFFAL